MKRKQKASSYNEMCRLAKRHRISFKSPDSELWPALHRNTFAQICSIRDQKFDDYCADNYYGHPWRAFTKIRAKFLTRLAATLLERTANETEWRNALEGEFLLRFRAEVACPACRGRIWKSDFEAYIEPSADINDLRKRRKQRVFCHCPSYRVEATLYEIGGRRLFDSRLEHVIIHDADVQEKLQLPDKKPDQVIGLRETTAFEKLFEEFSKKFGNDDIVDRLTPFDESEQPLLLPFLILEAKSEDSADGFNKARVQTAFPIWALLKLQEGVRVQTSGDPPNISPLVWYFANRGEYWRVYGCYISNGTPEKYEIVQLWDGCVTEKDASLQLLLIVDYIFDWARDIYRPSILRMLKSAASGVAYDQVTLANDSDIFSDGQRIANWIPAPPTSPNALVIRSDVSSGSNAADHESAIPVSKRNARLKTIREAMIFHATINFEGLGAPKDLPQQHRHHFSIIRRIWATRYSEYMQRKDIDPHMINQQKQRVKELRNRACAMLKSIGTNEGTWRDVEILVFKRFDEEIVCQRCKNEKWKSDYEADPFDEEDEARLENERKDRNACRCYQNIETIRFAYDDSDDECESAIFDKAVSARLIRDPDEHFRRRYISTHPDRVLGLKMTDRYRRLIASCPPELTHCPVQGMNLLYPFIILEAKGPHAFGSFEEMKDQAAFPLRLFLELQDALRKASRKSLDPLVWFFAYRGEDWRLYAGTVVKSNLRLFDLWHGCIAFHDGALQLFQIVDFIWTWARDVYGPQLQNCLRELAWLGIHTGEGGLRETN
ncbi:uncharacterized protein Z518_07245 [Rhinocladiella mackenziei CBS 650.93]|uniref:Rhinocladiella mackenziei CBS 650.93 unplaced genomic scaffold supercont1.5, whole genome shotgun sequence n=1 Tax=Rhinocladiella mackenziei CBS 650.93 TaxID=1442369 RepID=A0A0D2FNN9_9EURO|nr:uncharacterized protein Z518_07245 [Rhinocladiella mackenziei CBS 650.93]KIX03692.1 hypothetical protein Z518_07245 [Rhinocladiella mackenziei CBS 650.93]